MLDDRKFFNPVNSEPAAESRGSRRGRSNRWRPMGPDQAVTMDEGFKYVGDHSPRIALAGSAPRGIQQAGLALESRREYEGRVVLAGDPGARVTVSLVWGDGPNDRQTVPINGLGTDYATFPLAFKALGDNSDGRLEIAGTGQGSFHIGAVSLMPADNIFGFRADTTLLLRQIPTGMWRFPGGNFLSAHDWHDEIGDPDKRPPRWDPVWSAIQPNDVGIDEFMTFLELIDVDPFLSVNAGFGDAHSAAEEVEYVNGSADTPMGKLRAANGHPKPYGIEWWGVGNEMYGQWQFGYMALDQFVVKYNMFAKAMRDADPTIKLIATGAMPDQMTVFANTRQLTGKIVPEYGSKADWNGGLFEHCLDNIDILSEHFYSHAGQWFDIEKGERVNVEEPLVDWVRWPANIVQAKVEYYEEYEKRFPALAARRIPMVIDEWAYSRTPANLKLNLAHALVFHEMFRHTDLITMAGHTMGTSLIDFNATGAALNTNGMLFKLYGDHYGTIPVAVGGNLPVPPPHFPVGGDQPKINAGSPTYPVDVTAALTADGKALTVAVLNPTESEQTLDLSFSGIELGGTGRMWRMTGPSSGCGDQHDEQ